MTMVLVHGGGLGKNCWEPLLPFLDGDVVAVDLPGRGDRPADLSKVGIADFVDAVVDDLESRDLHDVLEWGLSILVPEKQDRFIESLGGCEVLELDAGHMAMISRPQDLAALLSPI